MKKTKIQSHSSSPMAASCSTLGFASILVSRSLCSDTSLSLKVKSSTLHSLQNDSFFYWAAVDVPAWIRSHTEIMGHGPSLCPMAVVIHRDRTGVHGSFSSIGSGRKSLLASSGGPTAEMEQEIWNVTASPYLRHSTTLFYYFYNGILSLLELAWLSQLNESRRIAHLQRSHPESWMAFFEPGF